MSFADTDVLYVTAERATATREAVEFPAGASFASRVRALSKEIDADEEDELLGAFIRRCRRMLRLVNLTPLSPDSSSLGLQESADYLRSLAESGRGSYPDRIAALAELCVDALDHLSGIAQNPLGDVAGEILRTGSITRSAVVIQSPLVDDIRDWLDGEAPGAALLTQQQLERSRGFETLIFIGPSSWYPLHVLSAPRAETLCFLHYAWLRDRELDTRLFAASSGPAGAKLREDPQRRHDYEISADELVPAVNWEALAKAVGRRRLEAADDPDLVEGRLFVLAGGLGVYLEAGDGATIDILDLECDGGKLRTVKARTVGPGDYVVLRTAGGTGDYIPAIADALLKRKAADVRSLQHLWKATLRERVLKRGFGMVESELLQQGIRSPNLRYRLWYRSIKTRNPEDFRHLMDYLDLSDRADVIWTAMGVISDAHRRAGHEVRRLLERAVESSSLADLEQVGRIDVSLDEIEAGTLSAIRVEGRDPSTVQLGEDELRTLIEVDEDLWHG